MLVCGSSPPWSWHSTLKPRAHFNVLGEGRLCPGNPSIDDPVWIVAHSSQPCKIHYVPLQRVFLLLSRRLFARHGELPSSITAARTAEEKPLAPTACHSHWSSIPLMLDAGQRESDMPRQSRSTPGSCHWRSALPRPTSHTETGPAYKISSSPPGQSAQANFRS